jgi:hypothetical protein
MAHNRHIFATISRLASGEREFLRRRFVGAAIRGRGVRTRIGDAACTLTVTPESFEGIGLFAPTSITRARLVRPVSRAERRAFFEALPATRMILLRRQGELWRAIPAHAEATATDCRRLVPVRLVEGCFLFDGVIVRTDREDYWFDAPDDGPVTVRGDRLREALAGMVPPHALTLKYLTSQQRAAYESVYQYRMNLRRRLARQRAGRR